MPRRLAVITGVAEELLESFSPNDYSVGPVLASNLFDDLVLAVPDNHHADKLKLLADRIGINFHAGDQHNVYNRFCEVLAKFPADIISRFQLRASWVDLELVRCSIDLVEKGFDFADYASNINYAMGCDTFSFSAFMRTGEIIEGLSANHSQRKTFEFSPWACMQNETLFKVGMVQSSLLYPQERAVSIRRRLDTQIGHKQNMIGSPADPPAPRYLKVGSMLNPDWHVCEISSGLGGGAAYMSTISTKVTAYEIDPSYVDQARRTYANYGVDYVLGGGDVLSGSCAKFDCVVSLHTLEHVPDDRTFIQQIREALRIGGTLIIEVPRLMAIPMGMPLWPFHEREYSYNELRSLLEDGGFYIRAEFGVSRNDYVEIHKAREAMLFVAERRA
ncbi:MAG: methyltransferase domain-containing protein [Leptolyngbyaceae bacterium]|nr:methyltransferase domain-containing protein [Leptolyngbyaceae bacterium]